MSTNPQLDLAYEYVSRTRRHVYLTGKAGTGKTTFLHKIRAEVPKHAVVVAPTGVAAINARGQTIHSLFQLPFGVIRPGMSRARAIKFSGKKKRLLNSIDLLIIDEVSMVRADVLDGIDEVLRTVRRRNEAFGGVQLLLIGDLHQLPPVVTRDEEYEMARHYDTAYFFGSRALRRANPVPIELTHIYRQADAGFIDLLNRVRNNRLDATTLATLNERYDPNFTPTNEAGCITLTSHNAAADTINDSQLARLSTPPHRYQATTTGDFPTSMYPNKPELIFKVGAQVMFNRNDPMKSYFNGKIGEITAIEEDRITVKCPEEEEAIAVHPITWENVKYEADKTTGEIIEDIKGTYTQHPLRLAWAVTIHKSQGLTFERVAIDAAAAFAHGQVYVALSRCKTLEGITLCSRIATASVKTDRVVSDYTTASAENAPGPADLARDKRAFERLCLVELFRCDELRAANAQFKRALFEHERRLQAGGPQDYAALARRIEREVIQPAHNFLSRHASKWGDPKVPEADLIANRQRLVDAGKYFRPIVQDSLFPALEQYAFLTDNESTREAVTKKLGALQEALQVARATFAVAEQGFDAAAYCKARTTAKLRHEVAPTPPKRNHRISVPPKLEHPELYRDLARWRIAKAAEREVDLYVVAHNSVLINLATLLPRTKKELLDVPKVGKVTAKRHGEDWLALINAYTNSAGIPLPSPSDKATVVSLTEVPSCQQSFQLFNQGCNIAEVAAARKLKESTIEGHLVRYVASGQLPVARMVDKEALEVLLPVIQATPTAPAGYFFQILEHKYDYGQIRAVMAHCQWLLAREEVA